ncbi:MAG: hypothetical protein K6F94_08540 [Bacteroidaceae bacterium]|nr:hypothetical protein [Bacteroidaceae bacterium]
MKRNLTIIILAFSYLLPVMGMPYKEAREQALYLTDKMAYELNLNSQQYNDCYEINLDYFLSVQTPEEIYGPYLAYRNADLRHILLDWQYSIFTAVDYFFHPLAWLRGVWHYPIYRHYAVNHYYYSQPKAFWRYHGGHGRSYFAHGYYTSRRPKWDGGLRGIGRYQHPSSTRITASRSNSYYGGHRTGSTRDNYGSSQFHNGNGSSQFHNGNGTDNHVGTSRDGSSTTINSRGSSYGNVSTGMSRGSNSGISHSTTSGPRTSFSSGPSSGSSRGSSASGSGRGSGGRGR